MKLNILYAINKSKVNSKGLCGITCRLTYLGKRKQFSTGLSINPSFWNSKQRFVMPDEPDTELINTQLSLIRINLTQAFLFLQVRSSDFTVDDIYKQYKGETPKKEFGVMEVYNLHSARIKRLIGIDIQIVTYQKSLESGVHLQSFIKHKFKAKDPFILYKAKRVKKEVLFLSPEQLKKLEETDFKIKRVQQIKDMFVFCCYTGLGIKEMVNLKKQNITIEFDGELWINVHRNKTQRIYKVPLLPKALEINDMYNDESSDYKSLKKRRLSI